MVQKFVLLAMAFPDAMPNRVDTWKSRIENFSDKNAEEAYQVEKAKIAIATKNNKKEKLSTNAKPSAA